VKAKSTNIYFAGDMAVGSKKAGTGLESRTDLRPVEKEPDTICKHRVDLSIYLCGQKG
jgi:hypothetical protein